MSWTMHCCSGTSQLYPLYVGANVFLALVVSDELTDDAQRSLGRRNTGSGHLRYYRR